MKSRIEMSKIVRYISAICLFVLSVCIAKAQTDNPVIENYVLTAVEKYNNGDIDAAIGMLTAVVEKDQTNDAAYYYLAQSYIRKRELELAESCLLKAVQIDGSNYWYRQRLATLYAATYRGELAIAIYEKLLEDFPKKSDIYLELVELYASQREIDKALKTIDEVEKVFGVTESLAVYKYNLLRMAQRDEEAYKSLEKYNEKYSSPYVLSTLADWQISMYKDSTALAYYNEALDLDSEYAPAQLGKADVLRMQRNYSGFFSMLNKFVKNETASSSSKEDYLMAVMQRLDPKFLRSFSSQVDTVMRNFVETHPKDSLSLQTAGLWFYSIGKNEDAAVYFKRNADEYPQSLSAIAGYTEFLMYSGMWKELSVEGRRAFNAFPDEPSFLEMASIADYNLGHYEQVFDICNQILEVAPKDSARVLRAWSTKGDIHHALGENKKAYKAYERALKVNPNYEYVLNNYAYFLSVEGKNLKKAYEMSKKTVEKEPDNATYLDTFGWIIYLQGRPMEAKQFFKRAMLYGGKDSAVILDHYAEVLYALKEYDMAFVYWSLALQKNTEGEIPDLESRIKQRKKEAGR